MEGIAPSRLVEEETFARAADARALARLREVRLAGETVADEGDFLAREVEGAYRERARAAGLGRSRGFGGRPGHAR